MTILIPYRNGSVANLLRIQLAVDDTIFPLQWKLQQQKQQQ